MTTQDLRNLAQLIFSRRGVRLWPYEPRLKRIPDNKGGFRYVQDIQKSLPKGTPDMIGRHSKTAVWYGCENKTITDRLSKDQIKQLDRTISDGGEGFVLKEINDEECELLNWRTKKSEKIMVEDYK